MQQQIHLAEKVRQSLGFNPVQTVMLQTREILRLPTLLFQMLESLDEKSPGVYTVEDADKTVFA